MTPPPQHPGGPTPYAQNPATAPHGGAAGGPAPYAPQGGARRPVGFPPPPLGPLAADPHTPHGTFPTGTPPHAGANVPPHGSPIPSDPIPEAERTVSDGPAGRSGLPPYGAPPPGPAPYGPPGAPFTPSATEAPSPPRPDAGVPPYGPAPTGGGSAPEEEPAMAAGSGIRDEASSVPPTPPYGPGAADGSSEAGTGQAAADDPAAARTPSPGTPMPEAAGQAVTFQNGQVTLALARLSAEAGPELTPDAILPPGTPLQAPPEPPPPDPTATKTGPIPRLDSGTPGGPGGPPPAGGGLGGSSGARRALLVGGGLLTALLLGGGGALAVTSLSGGTREEHKAAQTAPPPRPTPTPSKTKAKHKPKPVPVDIRDEKKDPKPLTVGEVFPDKTLILAGHKFVLAKSVINDHCSLAANGPFATELAREYCRRVVRATFVSDDKKLAVTTGIAVMPTDAAARAVLKVQDPAHYKWFRGLKAPGAPKIDQAGGFAASTMRGRYISYAYATYADGHKPSSKDTTLKKVGTAFRDSTIRPIERRAKKH